MEWDQDINTFQLTLKRLQKEHAHQSEFNVICLNYVNQFQNQLRQDFEDITDINENEIIYFFKHIKPVVVAHSLYYRKIIQLEHEKPEKSKPLKRYFSKQLELQYLFKLQHKTFVYYLNSSQSHLDALYFTCREPLPYDPDDLQVDRDRSYTTPRGLLTAKLLCDALLKNYLKAQLKQLKKTDTTMERPHLDWSGSRTDLIELTYALYHTKVIHKGKADIIEIARALSSFFNVDPGDVYKTYSEIKSRKKSRTKFLNELTIHLQHAMDRDDF